MKLRLAVMLMVLTIIALVAMAQTTSRPRATVPGGTDPSSNATVNPQPQSSAIRILTPVAGQNSTSNIVNVRFELVTPATAASTPNFQIQLDGGDPVTTSSTSYTFTGLAPGQHSVTVTLVDANGTPLAGGRATVQFAVAQPTRTGKIYKGLTTHQMANLATPEPPELASAGESRPAVVDGGSSLPLISVIGFGVLIGGVASAMKTR